MKPWYIVQLTVLWQNATILLSEDTEKKENIKYADGTVYTDYTVILEAA